MGYFNKKKRKILDTFSRNGKKYKKFLGKMKRFYFNF